MTHEKIDMVKNAKYRITVDKYVSAHRLRCSCNCSAVVLNLLGGKRYWTRVKFDCGEIIKINCHCLEKITE